MTSENECNTWKSKQISSELKKKLITQQVLLQRCSLSASRSTRKMLTTLLFQGGVETSIKKVKIHSVCNSFPKWFPTEKIIWRVGKVELRLLLNQKRKPTETARFWCISQLTERKLLTFYQQLNHEIGHIFCIQSFWR